MLSDFKAQAEALVLRSNDIDGLLTCALRPSNVFGHGDSHLVPFLVNLAKSGWGKVNERFGERESNCLFMSSHLLFYISFVNVVALV